VINIPGSSHPIDQILKALSWLFGILILGYFFYLTLNIVSHGFSGLSWGFLFELPENAGRQGGIAPMLVSTVIMLILCLLISLPIGIGSAIFLSEYTQENQIFTRIIRESLIVIASIPSIVMGLFGYAFFVVKLNLGFSLLSGALTLTCMVLPLLIRTIEESLRSIPSSHRLNAQALGLPKWRIIFELLLPMASQGILLAIILSIGRAMAETAALLYTSGYVMRMPESIMDSGRSLSVHIFDLSMNVPGGEQAAYSSALILIMLLFGINSITLVLNRIITKRSVS